MLGVYDNFPVNLHKIENFSSIITSKQLQMKLIQLFCEINLKTFGFEEIANPTIPNAKIVFEVGLAESKSFCYIDQQEAERANSAIKKERYQTLDFFCAIRYHKILQEKKSNLKFDYYMIRMLFGKNTLEVQIHHEKGPRYLTPEDLSNFIFEKINSSSHKILARTDHI